MNDKSFATVEEYVKKNNLEDYTDRTDADILESLGSYGVIRNPDTNETISLKIIYCQNGDEIVEFGQREIDYFEVKYELSNACSGFFSYLGTDKSDYIANLDNSDLSGSIDALRAYYGDII